MTEANKQEAIERIANAFSDHDFFSNCVLDHVDLEDHASIDASVEVAKARDFFENRWVDEEATEERPARGFYHDLYQEMAREEGKTGLVLTDDASLRMAVDQVWDMARNRLDHVLESRAEEPSFG